jgi:zinc resistance-associated protein
MKRLGIVLGSMTLVAMIASTVLAWGPGWGRDRHMMGDWGGGPGYCRQYEFSRGYDPLPEEQRTKLDALNRKFYDDTRQLRSSLWTKTGELNILLGASNPDLEKARALQREISELRAKLSEKRLEYDFEARKVAPDQAYTRRWGKGYGYGRHGKGYGPKGRGYGRGNCWN